MKNASIKISLIALLIILSTYKPKFGINIDGIVFPIKSIIVQNTYILEKQLVLDKLSVIMGKSLMFVDKKAITQIISDLSYVDSARIKKIYPSTIKILIKEKKPVATYMDKKKKYYLNERGDLIKYIEHENYKSIPTVFGKNINFGLIYKKLKKTNFSLFNIKSFYYFEIGRWDIVTKNNKILKLPTENLEKSLLHFIDNSDDPNFYKFEIFDYRIKGELILQ